MEELLNKSFARYSRLSWNEEGIAEVNDAVGTQLVEGMKRRVAERKGSPYFTEGKGAPKGGCRVEV